MRKIHLFIFTILKVIYLRFDSKNMQKNYFENSLKYILYAKYSSVFKFKLLLMNFAVYF